MSATKRMTPLEMVANMRDWLDRCERHLKRKQMYGAYKDFKALQQCAGFASGALAKVSVKAAMDWGNAIYVKDGKGKGRIYIMDDEL